MEPREYIPAFLEHEYRLEHPDLTPAAIELLHDKVLEQPDMYATSPRAQALVSYARVREHLLQGLHELEDLPDETFDQKRQELFDRTRNELVQILQVDEYCIDAQLLYAMLAEVPLDSCLSDLMKIADKSASYLANTAPGFDAEAPHYWDPSLTEEEIAYRTRTNPVAVGWLHALEALSHGCISSARYRAGISYAQRVVRSRGYTHRAEGTILLAQARLEDEDGFFATLREGGPELENSPWYLLGRTILLYKLGRRKNAQRALRDFAARCEGGAFFLLNPTYLTPYLPVRPEPQESWDLTHQAVYEADSILVDTPDFPSWAQSIEGIEDISEDFARRYGF